MEKKRLAAQDAAAPLTRRLRNSDPHSQILNPAFMTPTMPTIRIAPAEPSHVPLILSLIRELAEFEKLLREVTASEAQLKVSLFGEHPYAEVLIAWIGEEAAGFALFFHNYSTFLAKPGIYLEDLYVRPQFRGAGCGKALLIHLAQLAVQRGCGRLEWSVLDWNERAIAFYESLGAKPLDEWTMYRVTGEALEKLASSEKLAR